MILLTQCVKYGMNLLDIYQERVVGNKNLKVKSIRIAAGFFILIICANQVDEVDVH